MIIFPVAMLLDVTSLIIEGVIVRLACPFLHVYTCTHLRVGIGIAIPVDIILHSPNKDDNDLLLQYR